VKNPEVFESNPAPLVEARIVSDPQAITSDFESFYRAHVRAVGDFFARRSIDPHVVADLTSDTFVKAMSSAHSFAGRGTPRAWVLAIARAVYAQHQAELIGGRAIVTRLSGRVDLQLDQIEDLLGRIDGEHDGRELLARAAQLSDVERSALELVDLAGLTPQEAAQVLGISTGALRVRLFRARTHLRKEEQ
jgi:RNA polymerase sigma factor (sigma-70 family)